jgi:hypothetical protein
VSEPVVVPAAPEVTGVEVTVRPRGPNSIDMRAARDMLACIWRLVCMPVRLRGISRLSDTTRVSVQMSLEGEQLKVLINPEGTADAEAVIAAEVAAADAEVAAAAAKVAEKAAEVGRWRVALSHTHTLRVRERGREGRCPQVGRWRVGLSHTHTEREREGGRVLTGGGGGGGAGGGRGGQGSGGGKGCGGSGVSGGG